MILSSPDEAVDAIVTENGDRGRPTLAVRHEGEAALEPSPLGIETFDASFTEDLDVTEIGRRELETTYSTPAGKRGEHHHRVTEVTFSLASSRNERVELDVRAANDGVAYRYRLPGRGPTLVSGEESAFRISEGADAWLAPIEAKHEGVYHETTAAEAAGEYDLLALFESEGTWTLLAEADVDGRYVTSHLSVEAEDTLFRLRFPDDESHRMEVDPYEVSAELPLTTPWRVAIVGSLATVVESDLVADLVEGTDRGADPSRIADRSWIRPGRVAWSWWSDGASPGDPDVQRSYVDYAAARGWEYVLVDAGWKPDWIPDLVDYAAERDVAILIWGRWSDLNTPAKREKRLSRWRSWGVSGVKVDYMNSDGQKMMAFYDDLAAATADRELLLNLHGSIPPKGLRRRWPHLLSYEGVHGAENYHPAPKTIPPEHNVVLPCTRNVVGPMDYTPVTFSAETRQTTDGHELALSVVFESGLQHFADAIEEYRARPLAERFLERVPAAWDETAFVDGRPGDRVTFARRSGEEWFLGTIVAGEGRRVAVPLSFLPPEGSYEGRLVRDDAEGESLVEERDTVDSDDTLAAGVPENGGFVVHLRPP